MAQPWPMIDDPTHGRGIPILQLVVPIASRYGDLHLFRGMLALRVSYVGRQQRRTDNDIAALFVTTDIGNRGIGVTTQEWFANSTRACALITVITPQDVTRLVGYSR
mgnify:CR=1 FL=1